jgi:hypothetical protein
VRAPLILGHLREEVLQSLPPGGGLVVSNSGAGNVFDTGLIGRARLSERACSLFSKIRCTDN